MADVTIAAGLLALAVAYTTGWRNLGARAEPRRLAAFGAALATLLVALLSPLAGAADRSLTAHMTQHVLLIAVVPPLLLAARAGATTLCALRLPRRRRVLGRAGTVFRAARHPAAAPLAVVLQLTTMGLWHAPALYDAAATHAALHALEHLTLLGTSLLLWWTVALAIRTRPAVAVGSLFVASIGCTALGAAMVLTHEVWYPLYSQAEGRSALADQQLAGVVMWGFANLVLVVATCSVVAMWLTRLEHTAPNRPAHESAAREAAP